MGQKGSVLNANFAFILDSVSSTEKNKNWQETVSVRWCSFCPGIYVYEIFAINYIYRESLKSDTHRIKCGLPCF